MKPEFVEFPTRGALADRLAARVKAALEEAIAARGRAILAVSGGSTPVRFFQALSKLELAWEQVTVILVDERMVPASHERSNAKLVRENLLQNHAANAFFVPMFQGAFDEGDAAHQIETVMKRAQLVPADMLILGMGNDGHTASFFPGRRSSGGCHRSGSGSAGSADACRRRGRDEADADAASSACGAGDRAAY